MANLRTRQSMDAAGDLLNLRRLNRVLDSAFLGWPFGEQSGTINSSWMPACDVFEDASSLKIVLEMPGVRAQDVKLSLENNVLGIRGEKKQEAEETTDRVHRYERTYGTFERAFTLPGTVDVDRVEAKLENGVLTVTLPKIERGRPREIAVKAG